MKNFFNDGKIIIASRASPLAIKQCEIIIKILKDFDTKIIPLKTRGDKIQNRLLSEIGGKGLFIKEVEKSVITKKAHIAIHSMKDLEWKLNNLTKIGAVPIRESYSDIFISKWENIENVPKNIRIGTSSVRRKAFLLAYNPKFKISLLRGNINTRIKKFFNGDFDAIVLSEVGLKRLGIKVNYFKIPEEILLPSPGQGALAVQCLKNSNYLVNVLNLINDKNAYAETNCERIFTKTLNGNCSSPISALAKIKENEITLQGAVAKEDGSLVIRDSLSGHKEEAEKIGMNLGLKILEEVKMNGSFL